MKEFVVKQDKAFRLHVKSWKCLNPKDLNSIEFIQDCFDKDGEIDFTTKYQFFMTDEELNILAKGLAT